jgi:drug/metabolite transporter (DMT)-like permease
MKKTRKYMFSSTGLCLGYCEVIPWQEKLKKSFWITSIIVVIGVLLFLTSNSKLSSIIRNNHQNNNFMELPITDR